MSAILVDALYPAGIPLRFSPDVIMASYVDHPEVSPNCMVQLAERFPHNPLVTIAAHYGDAQICDVETGAMAAADVPAWCARQRSLGTDPSCYASPANWSDVCRAFANTPGDLPHWWAVDRRLGPVIPSGAVGNQWLGAGGYDLSIITDGWARILTHGANQVLSDDDKAWLQQAIYAVSVQAINAAILPTAQQMFVGAPPTNLHTIQTIGDDVKALKSTGVLPIRYTAAGEVVLSPAAPTP